MPAVDTGNQIKSNPIAGLSQSGIVLVSGKGKEHAEDFFMLTLLALTFPDLFLILCPQQTINLSWMLDALHTLLRH
jgi:hypothetical protein